MYATHANSFFACTPCKRSAYPPRRAYYMPLAGGLKETLIRDLRALPPPTPRVTARMTAEFDALGHLSELLLSFEHEYEAIEQSVWHVQRALAVPGYCHCCRLWLR